MAPSSFHVSLTQDAIDDLELIGAYIAHHGSADDAVRLLDRVDARIDSLEQFPSRGNVPKELSALGKTDYRQSIVRPYRLLYRIDGSEVTVVLIADGRRDMKSLIRERLLGA